MSFLVVRIILVIKVHQIIVEFVVIELVIEVFVLVLILVPIHGDPVEVV